MALLDARALRDALHEGESVAEALAIYQRQRRAHVGIYHFWSRWLTRRRGRVNSNQSQ